MIFARKDCPIIMRILPLVYGATLAALLIVAAAGQQNSGFLKTKISPGRAGVFVDGKYLGPAANFGFSRKYAVAAGKHEVRFSDPRYEDVVKQVTIESGKTVRLAETMKPLPAPKPPFGKLRTISTEKFAAVYVNGKFMGHAGEFNNPTQGLLLNPGEYSVKIVPVNGTDAKEEKIKVEANKTVIVHAAK